MEERVGMEERVALSIGNASSQSVVDEKPELRNCFFEYGMGIFLVSLFSSAYVGCVYGLLSSVFTAPILRLASYHDYFSMLMLFGMCVWAGFLSCIVISGPCMNLTPESVHFRQNEPEKPWQSWLEFLFVVLCLLLSVGMYCFAFGAYYIFALVIMGIPFGIGCAVYRICRTALRRVFPNKVYIQTWKYGIVKATCPVLTIVLVLILKSSWVAHRESLLSDHAIPHDDIVHGVWDMVTPTNATTGYRSLELKRGPPASKFQDFSNHAFKHAGTALSTKVVKAFVAMPVGYHSQDLACAHVRGQPGYIVLLHDNGILGFVPKIFDAREYTKYESVTKDELVCFAQIEDSRFTLIDCIHGILHGCFCFGKFTKDGKLQRYNRWAWDTGLGWQATRHLDLRAGLV